MPVRKKVVITGITGNLGLLLAKKLHREADVYGIDRRPSRHMPKDVKILQRDIRRKACEDIFRSNAITAVIHLNILHDPRAHREEAHSFNLMGTSKILEYCNKYNIPKVVLLSSANVYGPSPNNNQFITEETPLLGSTRFAEIRDLVEFDLYSSSFFWRYPNIETVLLRPVHILGKVRNAPSNYLRLPVVPTLMGFDPMIQVIHVEDVVEAILLALQPGIRGVYNIVGPGEVPLSMLLKTLQKRRLNLPNFIAKSVLDVLWKTKLTSFPPPELEFIQYICMADGSRSEKEMGYFPKYSLKDTIKSVQFFDVHQLPRTRKGRRKQKWA